MDSAGPVGHEPRCGNRRSRRTFVGANDAVLIGAVAAQSPEALAEVWRRHRPSMLQAAGRVCGPARAEDAVHEVLETLWLAPGRYNPALGSLRGYLLLQSRHRAIDIARADGARVRRESTHLPLPQERDVEEHVLWLHSADVVAAAVRRLPDVERTAVALAFFADHSYRDVARLMQLPEGTTKSLIRRALRRLNEQLALRAGE